MNPMKVTFVAGEAAEAALRLAMPEMNGNLRRCPPEVLHGPDGVQRMLTNGPDVIAFGADLELDTTLEVAGWLDRAHPNVEVLVVAKPSPNVWERAARVGVREVVPPTAPVEELVAALRRTMATAQARVPLDYGPEDQDTRQRVLVVRSPKGGSGKTMLATSLGVTLARAFPDDVVLVDLDLQFGDTSSALGIEPTYTIADATASAELTPTSLKTFLATHESSLHALCAPAKPSDADAITGDDVTAVLGLLRSAFRFVVVDTPAGSDPRTDAALSQATDVVLVCSMDVSSVRALRKDLDVMAPGGPDVHLILNRAETDVAIDVRDIEATLGRRVDARISSSRTVPLRMNCGVPVVDADPSSLVARQLTNVARHLVDLPAAATKQRRRWRRRT
jgi:pilus assembly protein CpaE